MSEVRWSIIVHGGARDIPHQARDAHRAGCAAAVRAGVQVLAQGGPALDAAEAAVRVLEDDPTFNAGYGSVLNADGEVEMDAAIMDGSTLDIGGIGAIRGVRHPVSVARALLAERPTLLVAEGARRFARAVRAELCAPDAMIAPEPRAAFAQACDTVGCVAMDGSGRLAAATSTGGLTGKAPGRIGDSPLPGSGLYARDGLGGVCFSGEGEAISRLTLAAEIMHRLKSPTAGQSLRAMVDEVLEPLTPLGGDGGAILIDGQGRIDWAHNSPQFAVAHARNEQPEPRAFVQRNEDDHG